MTKTPKPEVLDPETQAALEEGIRMAEANPQRWSPDEVMADAKRLAKEWREKVSA